MNIFLHIVLLLTTICNSQQTSKNNNPITRLSFEQSSMEEVGVILNDELHDLDITNVRIIDIKTQRRYYGKKRLCNIIRAPNHRPFHLIKRLNHKMRNQTEWEKIVIEESVIYKLEDLDKLEFALSMEVIGGKTLAVVFEDGETIFYEQGRNLLHEVTRKTLCPNDGKSENYISMGKIVPIGNSAFFISPECIAIIHSDLNIQTLSGFDKQSTIYNVALSSQNKNTHIYLAIGQNGLAHYSLRQGSTQLQKMSNLNVVLNSVKLTIVDILEVTDIVDHALGQSVFLLLDPNVGIVKIAIPREGASPETVQATSTTMPLKNCRYLKLHQSKVYTSCPQVIIYDPKKDLTSQNVILAQLPTELISTENNMVIMSHNEFQTFDQCTGIAQSGSLEGQSFHHTVNFGGKLVSIDDLSVFLWEIRPMDYFLACKGDEVFKGLNTVILNVNYNCKNEGSDTNKCCSKTVKFEIEIYDSSEGYHIFEIIGVIVLSLISLMTAAVIILKKKRQTQEYNQLLEQEGKQKNNDLSVIEDKRKKIEQTQQSIVEDPKENAIQLEIKN